MKATNFLLVILFSLWGQGVYGQAHEKGVSKELAEQRVKNISNISYDLTFDIPSNQQEPVKGKLVLEFFLDEKKDVVLDFQGKFSGVCVINDKSRAVDMENEHIILPGKRLKKGINSIEIDFVSLDKGLNRFPDYIYTLFVPDQARSCFPCFDQPDMRATFTTHLNMPNGWKSIVSNGKYPIPTYLYSFVAGKFEEQIGQREGYKIHALYREQDPQKVKQLGKIFDEVGISLHWMEGYTGIKYPLEEFGMIILPGYQFGGMENPGAVQLTDRRIFLGSHPSKDEQLSRMELIAHETAHQWFGNMVTLKWFGDVWTKEVFANFMASKITRQKYSRADHDLNFLKTYQSRAMAFDRSEGTHPIAQELKNLDNASLLYDDIIYDKAPVMMRILEEIMGAQRLQSGLQKYLQKYFFKSASWDDLIEVLDQEAPGINVRQFSDVWVKQKGMPTIHTTYQDGNLIISQTDPYGRGLCWRQKFEIRLIYDIDKSRTVTVDMQQPTVSIKIGQRPNSIIPNYNGRGYGRFTLDDSYTEKLPLRLIVTRNDLHRYALLLTLHDNYLMGRIPPSYFGELYRVMIKEKNPLIMKTAIDHMFKIAFDRPLSERQTLEQCIMDLLPENKSADCRQTIIRKMAANASAKEVSEQIYNIWYAQTDPLFDEHDYMEMAYRLAILRPQQWNEIISQQLSKLKTDDLREEFKYVSRACNPDIHAQKNLFKEILKKENRQHEPWALQALRLLNADVREPMNNDYIPQSLEKLEYIKETSDIFFAGNWLNSLLATHKSKEALQNVNNFIQKNPNYQPNLLNKIKAASWPLKTIHEMEQKENVKTSQKKQNKKTKR